MKPKMLKVPEVRRCERVCRDPDVFNEPFRFLT